MEKEENEDTEGNDNEDNDTERTPRVILDVCVLCDTDTFLKIKNNK